MVHYLVTTPLVFMLSTKMEPWIPMILTAERSPIHCWGIRCIDWIRGKTRPMGDLQRFIILHIVMRRILIMILLIMVWVFLAKVT